MQIQMLKVGILQTNCYLVWDTCTRDCAVIDPGGEAPRILEAIQTQSLEVRAYLLTHAHFDHFRALWPMYEAYPAPAYVGKEDLDPLVNPAPRRFVPLPDTRFPLDGDTIPAGILRFSVFSCPGHTPGGLSYLCEDVLFTGDTLFHLDCGRCDLPCSDPQALLRSLGRLRDLPGNYRVYPGHFDTTTLHEERLHNPYLQPGVVFSDPEPEEELWDPGKV